MQGFLRCSMRPDCSSMSRSTRRSTRACRPQYFSISASKVMPRFLFPVSSVETMACLLLTRTRSPGWRSSVACGVLASFPSMKGNRRPPLIRSGRGRKRRLQSWNSLNAPAQTLRIAAAAVALPERTSARYCLASQAGSRSGAARSSSVAWQENRSSPWALPLRAASARVATVAAACAGPAGAAAGAARSAAARLAVAAHPLEVDRVAHAVHPAPVDRVAQLAGQLVDPEPPSAELPHLGHERQRLELAAVVEGREDLGLAPHLDQLTDTQVEDVSGGCLGCAHACLSGSRAAAVTGAVAGHRKGGRPRRERADGGGRERRAAGVVAKGLPLVEGDDIVADADEALPVAVQPVTVAGEPDAGLPPVAARVAAVHAHAGDAAPHADVVVVDVDVVDVRQRLADRARRGGPRRVLLEQDAVVVAVEEVLVDVHAGAVGDDDPGTVEEEALRTAGGGQCLVPVDLGLAGDLVEHPPAVVGLEAVGPDDDAVVVDVEPEPATVVVVEPGALDDHALAVDAGELGAARLPVRVERERLVEGHLRAAQHGRPGGRVAAPEQADLPHVMDLAVLHEGPGPQFGPGAVVGADGDVTQG